MIRVLKYLINDYKTSLETLCRISKRSRLYLALDMLLCIVFRLTLPSEYLDFGYDFLPRSKRKDYFTLVKRKYAYRKTEAPRSRNITANKFYFASVMQPFFGRRFLHTSDMTLEDFRRFIEGEEKIIYKPISGTAGRGQIIYRFDGTRSVEDIFDEIKALPRALLETWIEQHEALNKLYPGAVHIARLHTIHDGSGENVLIYGSNLSIAFKGELANTCLDNTLSAQVDDATGVVTTIAFDDHYNFYETTPGTNVPIKGFQLPDWDKVLELCRRAAARIPEMRFIGWDVAFTPDGPVLVEGNGLPGNCGIQSRCWVNEGLTYGVWPIIKPYLKAKKN